MKKKFIKDKVFLIAEAGVNHNGSLKRAEILIKEAKKNGADFIKFQTYKASKLVIRNSPRFWNWDGEKIKKGTQFDTYKKLDGFEKKEYKKIKKLCDKHKIKFMSTPFDHEAVDLLYSLGMRDFKVASCDLTNFPLIRKILFKKNIRIFLSTGASNISEISKTLKFIFKIKKDIEIILMQCTLCYPTKYSDCNLYALKEMKKKFPTVILGLSDHSLGIDIAASSILLDVQYIEKHFTYNKKLKKSADHWLSIDPKELLALREKVDILTLAKGIEQKKVLKCENLARRNARRSIVARKFLPKNTTIKEDDIIMKRPGIGISPTEYRNVIGKKTKKNLLEDSLIKYKDLI